MKKDRASKAAHTHAEGFMRELNAVVEKKEMQKMKQYPSGLYVSDMMNQAEMSMRRNDFVRKRAAVLVQRRFREKLRARRARKAAEGVKSEASPASNKDLQQRLCRMLSKTVEAPAYFGESCLWVPFEEWSTAAPPMYMYSARCESRGELIQISRSAVRELILKFSPWLAERFEYYRVAVVEGFAENEVEGTGESPKGSETGLTSYRLPQLIDWAAIDLDLPEDEVVPMQAFQRQALQRDGMQDRNPEPKQIDHGVSPKKSRPSEDGREFAVPRAHSFGASIPPPPCYSGRSVT
jgi:hypothetical protein